MVGARRGKTMSIANTPIMTSLVFVSESDFPSFDGSVSYLNNESDSSYAYPASSSGSTALFSSLFYLDCSLACFDFRMYL